MAIHAIGGATRARSIQAPDPTWVDTPRAAKGADVVTTQPPKRTTNELPIILGGAAFGALSLGALLGLGNPISIAIMGAVALLLAILALIFAATGVGEHEVQSGLAKNHMPAKQTDAAVFAKEAERKVARDVARVTTQAALDKPRVG